MNFKLAWRNIWRNKRRSFITIGSILFAVFFALIMRSFQEGMYEMMIDNMVSISTGHLQVHKEGYWEDRSIDNIMTLDQDVLKEKEKKMVKYIALVQVYVLKKENKSINYQNYKL